MKQRSGSPDDVQLPILRLSSAPRATNPQRVGLCPARRGGSPVSALKGIRSGNVSIFAMRMVDSAQMPSKNGCFAGGHSRWDIQGPVTRSPLLRNGFTGFRPLEMGRIARRNDERYRADTPGVYRQRTDPPSRCIPRTSPAECSAPRCGNARAIPLPARTWLLACGIFRRRAYDRNEGFGVGIAYIRRNP